MRPVIYFHDRNNPVVRYYDDNNAIISPFYNYKFEELSGYHIKRYILPGSCRGRHIDC